MAQSPLAMSMGSDLVVGPEDVATVLSHETVEARAELISRSSQCSGISVPHGLDLRESG